MVVFLLVAVLIFIFVAWGGIFVYATDLNEKFIERKEKFKVHVESERLNKDTGIGFIKREEGQIYACYNFLDDNYCGFIKIDVRKIDIKKLDKIINILKVWAEKQNLKNARIRAYQSCGRI